MAIHFGEGLAAVECEHFISILPKDASIPYFTR
jgi:hypothetical protein